MTHYRIIHSGGVFECYADHAEHAISKMRNFSHLANVVIFEVSKKG